MHYHVEVKSLICFTRHIRGGIQSTSVVTGNCHFASGIFASKHRYFSNNTFIFYKYLSKISCNNTSANKTRSYLQGIVCCCALEFQFLSVPAHSRLPSRWTRFTFYVPSPPSHLGYYTGTSRIRRRGVALFLVLKFGRASWFLLSLFLYTHAGVGSVYTSWIWIRTACLLSLFPSTTGIIIQLHTLPVNNTDTHIAPPFL